MLYDNIHNRITLNLLSFCIAQYFED